jgi:hypothetical protein
MVTYPLGSPARLTFSFTLEDGLTPLDCDAVIVQHEDETGAFIPYTLVTGVVRDGPGVYHLDLLSLNAGPHGYKGYGYIAGARVAATVDYAFKVSASKFPLPT